MKPPICIGIHAVFSGNAYQDLWDADVKDIITCNTIPHQSNGIDLSDIIAKEVTATDAPHMKKSISILTLLFISLAVNAQKRKCLSANW